MHRGGESGPDVPAQTSALYFGNFRFLSILLFSDCLSLPLPQALHLARLKFGQILLLHVHATKLGTKDIMGNVLLLLGLLIVTERGIINLSG